MEGLLRCTGTNILLIALSFATIPTFSTWSYITHSFYALLDPGFDVAIFRLDGVHFQTGVGFETLTL